MRKPLFVPFALALTVAIGSLACGSPTKPGPGPGPIIDPPPPCCEPPPDPEPPTLRVDKVLTFGDSLTEGEATPLFWGLTDPSTPGVARGYPFKLATILTTTYTSQTIHVYNGGLGGEKVTKPDAKARFLELIGRFDPELVVLMHGANDLLGHLPMTTIIGSLEQLIGSAQARNIPVMLLTLPRQVAGRDKSSVVPEQVVKFNKELKEMAADEGAIFVDIYPYITDDMVSNDGLHLTQAGNQKIADLVYKAIKARYHVEAE